MSFKRKNPGNQSIRRQLTFYMGLFVVLPLCLALMLLNFYLQKVTTENKINNETDLLSQIRDNTEQMIEVTNYATSMLMINKNTLKNLRILEQDGDSYEIYQAKRELSNDISNLGKRFVFCFKLLNFINRSIYYKFAFVLMWSLISIFIFAQADITPSAFFNSSLILFRIGNATS